jgi:coenzyme F420-0:L-glutamate ligase/coenzyme F420-1:gamma-L-glutamate ligase
MITPDRVELVSWPWPDVADGDDLAALVCDCPDLRDGDIVVVTSKVVSKAEGRIAVLDREELVIRDTARVVARKGRTVIAQTSHGLVLAAAGVDASNVDAGRSLSLPSDPDESARRLRTEVLRRRGINVAVVITDTAGRAWRVGQVDIAIGCAGMLPVQDLAGTTDTYGNLLAVTASVVADEVAAAGDLVKGKTSRRPLAVLRGMDAAILPPGDHGDGAQTIVRDAAEDMFGLGARDAVIAAARRDPAARNHLPALTTDDRPPFEDVTSSHPHVRITITSTPESAARLGWVCQFDVLDDADREAWVELGRLTERIEALAWAHRLNGEAVRLDETADTEWRAVSRTHWIVA